MLVQRKTLTIAISALIALGEQLESSFNTVRRTSLEPRPQPKRRLSKSM